MGAGENGQNRKYSDSFIQESRQLAQASLVDADVFQERIRRPFRRDYAVGYHFLKTLAPGKSGRQLPYITRCGVSTLYIDFPYRQAYD
jgi:hypothetical protein